MWKYLNLFLLTIIRESVIHTIPLFLHVYKIFIIEIEEQSIKDENEV